MSFVWLFVINPSVQGVNVTPLLFFNYTFLSSIFFCEWPSRRVFPSIPIHIQVLFYMCLHAPQLSAASCFFHSSNSPNSLWFSLDWFRRRATLIFQPGQSLGNCVTFQRSNCPFTKGWSYTFHFSTGWDNV